MSNGGKLKASDITINKSGNSNSTENADFYGTNAALIVTKGTVTVKNSTLETNKTGSPIIYSTGKITVDKVNGTSNNAQAVVVEGKNSAKGNRGSNNKTDSSGVMIYQSASGDAGEEAGTFTSNDLTISIDKNSSYYKSSPMFFVTNTNAKINLTSTKLEFGSAVLLSAKTTNEWGKSESNGGNVTMNLKDEDIEGNMEVDDISSLTLNLTNSTLKTTINNNNTAKSIKLKLSSNSKIILTGDSYITNLDDEDESYSNIDLNGYTLYVNGKKLDI